MFIKFSCVYTNVKFTVAKYTLSERSNFCLLIAIKVTLLAFSLIRICSFEKRIVKHTDQSLCYFKCTVSIELDALKLH